MPADRYDRLLQLVHGRAGDSVRLVAAYSADDWQALYVRDDLKTEALRDAVPPLIDRLRKYEPIVVPELYDRVGPAEATVELHEHAAVVHIPEGDCRGVVVSLDREVARGLSAFVRNCEDVLTDE